MTSERAQRRIERLLDRIDAAEEADDWTSVQILSQNVLAVDPENAEAIAYLEAAERWLAVEHRDPVGESGSSRPSGHNASTLRPLPSAEEGRAPALQRKDEGDPTSFANDRYQVSRFLGEGGKKRVYLAHDTLLDREVAFALIKTEGFDQTSRERISREAQAMGRLGVHPNIVAVLDLGQEDDGSPYMVTELMGDGDVEALLDAADRGGQAQGPAPTNGSMGDDATGAVPRGRPAGGLSLERTIEIGKAVCEGLAFAHDRGIVHRDLKPGNVWLTEDGSAKIGDFGLAMLTDRSRLTREAMMVGTVSYMPPEQATGGEITPRADLYSLGAMLYEMVTGRPPFLGDEEVAIIGQHINTPPVAPTWHNGTCPRPLEALVMRMLAKDPSERPDSAQDVFNALEAIDLTARGETVEREANSLESLAGGVFVGRQAEMDQLKAALEDVLGGRGRLVTLVGEPGIGKTRTSEELATYAGLRGAQVLWGRCYEGGGAPPYWPWVQAIRSYVRDIESDELRRQIGSSASVVAEIVTDVKDRMPELQPPPQMDDPESARFRLFDSLTSFLRAASQSRPLVIVLDDLHWSDQPTLTFLEFIARELGQARVLLLCTYRDMELNRRHPLTVTLGDLARERLYERVLLRGLSETDIARFVEIAAGFSAPTELSATIQRHTEGNPLFVTEVIRDLVQSGELAEEKVSGRTTWSVRIPEGVREVIGRRLDRLSDRANEVFTTAAVIGRDFTLGALRELAEDTTEGQLLDVLDEALNAKLIEELSDEIGHFQFTHALVQETLTSELSLARRVRIHANIANVLERMYGTAADEHSVALLPHFMEAESVLGGDRVRRYATIAAKQAMSSHAYFDADRLSDIALRAVEDNRPIDHEHAELLVIASKARSVILKIQESIDALGKAIDFYLENDDVETAAGALRDAHNSGVAVSMIGRYERVIELLGDNSTHLGTILADFGLAVGFSNNNYDYDASRSALNRAELIAIERDDTRLQALVMANRVNVDGAAGKFGSAEESGERALELLAGFEPNVAYFRAAQWLAMCKMQTARIDDARALVELALDAATQRRDIRWQMQSRARLADIFASQGEWKRAREQAELVVERATEQDGGSWGSCQNVLANIGIQTGDETVLEGALEALDGAGDRIMDTSLMVSRAARSVGALVTGSTTVEDYSIPSDVVNTYTLRRMSYEFARGLDATGRGDRATAGDVLAVVSEVDWKIAAFGYVGLSVERLRGLLLTTLGRHDDAGAAYSRALEACREGGLRPELAWTLSDYAEMLLDRVADEPSSASVAGDRKKATALQDEALGIARGLDMNPLLKRILARREILKA